MTLYEQTEIAARPEAVWAAIHDYGIRLDWDTMLRQVAVDGRIAPESCPVGVGTEVTQWARWQAGGVAIQVCYTTYEPPTESSDGLAIVNMIHGPWFFDSFSAEVAIKRQADGSSLCDATYQIECRPRALRAIVEPATRFMFARETKIRWRALKRYLQRDS